jgi:Ca-activated chloride channel homolog
VIFASPAWLVALLALPLLAGLEVWLARRDRDRLSRLVSRPLWGRVVRRPGERWRWLRLALLLLGTAGLVLALARPQWGIVRERVEREGVDVVLVLDTSGSMATADAAPSRFFLARQALLQLVARLEGDRFALVAFEGEAYPLVPLTLDADALGLFLETVEPGIVPAPGTSLGVGLAKGLEAFVDEERRNKVMVLVSDGEDLEGEVEAAVRRAKEKGVVVHAVGVGTEGGQPVPEVDAEGRVTGYKRDESGSAVVSRLDLSTLEAIARGTGARCSASRPRTRASPPSPPPSRAWSERRWPGSTRTAARSASRCRSPPASRASPWACWCRRRRCAGRGAGRSRTRAGRRRPCWSPRRWPRRRGPRPRRPLRRARRPSPPWPSPLRVAPRLPRAAPAPSSTSCCSVPVVRPRRVGPSTPAGAIPRPSRPSSAPPPRGRRTPPRASTWPAASTRTASTTRRPHSTGRSAPTRPRPWPRRPATTSATASTRSRTTAGRPRPTATPCASHPATRTRGGTSSWPPRARGAGGAAEEAAGPAGRAGPGPEGPEAAAGAGAEGPAAEAAGPAEAAAGPAAPADTGGAAGGALRGRSRDAAGAGDAAPRRPAGEREGGAEEDPGPEAQPEEEGEGLVKGGRRRLRGLALAAVLAAQPSPGEASFTVRSEVDARRVGLEDQLQLTITVEGSGGPTRSPSPPSRTSTWSAARPSPPRSPS